MRPGPDPSALRWTALRTGAVGLLLAAGLAVVLGRAFQLQVLQREGLVDEMVDQYRRQLVLKPRRGVITDRAGVLLAGSADAKSVFADPRVLARDARRAEALRRLGAAVGVDQKTLQKKLARGGSRFAWLARRISPQQAAAVEKLIQETGVRGLALVPETRRYYPKVELASQLLGFVGDDGEGQEGLELARDADLQGEEERVRSLRDGAGRIALADAPETEAREGARIELTLDQGVQLTAERALSAAVQRSRALSGVAVVLDPTSGEVLAMASYPPYNPNAARDPAIVRNRAVTDAFEPGSTMKVLTLSGALEHGSLAPTDAIDTGDGRLTVNAHVIHDHGGLGWVGPSKIIAASSNVGAAKVGMKLGRQRLQETFQAFGLGERTGVGLPGEAKGVVPLPRSDLDLASQSFGHHLLATPLQITAAFAAIANQGVLLEPHVVRRVVDPATGDVLEEAGRRVVRQVISQRTAETMTRWLVGVIEDPKGTGHRARLSAWQAAGKTGTARKIDPVSGTYVDDRHMSSFVGFAPVGAPRVVIGVWLDEPRGEVNGGDVAAPAFREIAEYALKMLNVAPAPLALATPPPEPEPEAAPPAEDAEPEQEPAVELAAEDARPAGRNVTVPPLAGLPARTAIRNLEALQLEAVPSGAGRVVSQEPPAGRVVARGTRVRVRLAPAG
ncbi:MAG: penicillin-binding protein [Anaeromyxobacteraceae bacterium]